MGVYALSVFTQTGGPSERFICTTSLHTQHLGESCVHYKDLKRCGFRSMWNKKCVDSNPFAIRLGIAWILCTTPMHRRCAIEDSLLGDNAPENWLVGQMPS